MKTCSVCNQTKTNFEFNKDRTSPDYMKPWCRPCGRTKPRKPHALVPKDAPDKKCIGCQEIKKASSFYYNWKQEEFTARCKPCHAESSRKLYANKSKFRVLQNDAYYRRHYGITLLEVEELKQKANHQCQICSSEFSEKNKPRVDHCHSTGKIRGLLCHKCNVALGLLQDSSKLLRKAASYVSKTSKRKNKVTSKTIEKAKDTR